MSKQSYVSSQKRKICKNPDRRMKMRDERGERKRTLLACRKEEERMRFEEHPEVSRLSRSYRIRLDNRSNDRHISFSRMLSTR